VSFWIIVTFVFSKSLNSVPAYILCYVLKAVSCCCIPARPPTFRWIYRLHIRSLRVRQATSACRMFLAGLTLRPWTWRQYIPPKHHYTSSWCHIPEYGTLRALKSRGFKKNVFEFECFVSK
jgi:hypothetical protein